MANDKVDHATANDKRTIKKKLLVPVSFAVPAQGEDRTLSCSADDF